MPYVSDIRKICRAKIRNNAQSFIKLNRKNDRNISNVKFYSADNGFRMILKIIVPPNFIRIIYESREKHSRYK